MTVDINSIVILMGCFVVLVVLKFPITFCLALSAFVTAFYMRIPLSTLTLKMVASIDSFSLIAIPFFILAGEIMGKGGISDRLFKLANVLVGRVRGGPAMISAVDGVFFGMISGSAVACISSMGPIEIRNLEKNGYPLPFAVALSCSSAILALLIPPSHNMIIYSSAVGGVSVGKLFMAGLFPGIVLAILLMIYCYIMARKHNFPKGGSFTLKESLKVMVDSIAGLMTVIFIIGGVFLGIVTASESAVIACIWALIVALFIYKGIKIKDIVPILKRTMRTIALVMALIASAGAFGYMMTLLRIPEFITSGLLNISSNKYVLLILINIMLLFLGCIMDMAPLILIVAPILFKVVTSPVIGMDPVHFGVMLIYNLGMGLLTPPVGTVLFVGSAVGGIKIEQVFKSLIPFYLVMLIGLFLVTFIPAISMTIPNLMFGK